MMNDEDEPYMSPRQLWLYSGKLILEALRLVRSQTMSGRRFDALLQMARMNKKSLEDGSFNAAVANTPKVPRKNDDEKESLPEKVSLNLLSGATRIVRRVEPGSRDDVQLALIMSAFPLLKEIHNDKTAKNLCQAMKIRTVPAQTVLLERGTVGKDFVALLSGTIRLMVTTSNIIVEEKEEVIVMCEEEEEDGSENEDSEDSEEEGGGRKEEEKQNEKTRSINRPNGIHISTLKPGDLILRTARAIHLFESLSFGFTGRDGTDEEMVTVAYIDSTTYSNILFESKVIASVAFTKAAVQKRRQNLRDATKASRKLKEEIKVKTEENLVTPPTEFLIPTLTDCDRIRILMNKVPDRRSVEEIEFLIHYLDRFDYWNKLSVIKSHDDDAENYANRGGTSKKINKEKAINGLTSRLQREIVRHLSTLIYNKKEVIYEENDISEMYFFILKGSVVIRKRYGLNNTQSKTIHTLTSGSSFGENGLSKYSMMGGKEENHNYATTTSVTYENCEFLILSKSEYQRCADSFQEKHLEARLNILNLSPIFLDRIWTKKELKSIASPLETLEFSTDQTICQQGRFATHLYFVVRGECNAFKTLHHYNPNSSSTASSMKYHNQPQSNSYTMSLGRLSKGDCFGLQSCGGSTYAENMKYNVSVIATTPMAVFSLTRFDVFNRIDANIRIELQKKCETHIWNDNINLTRRLVNRNRFQIYLKNNERNVLPIKYLNRKTKNRKSSTNASLKSSYSTSLLPKLKNNSNLLSSSIELRPPPSRQCSRKAIHIAAAKQQSSKSSPPRITSLSSTGNHNSELSVDGNDTTMINSMVDWDDVQGTRANGLLPNIKPLKLPHNVIIHKIEMWSKNLTGAKINTFNIKEYDGTYDIKNGDDHEILVEEEQGEEE